MIVLGALGAACGSDSGNTNDNEQPTTAAATLEATVMPTESREVVVETRNRRFVPDEITVATGELVTLVLRNADSDMDHDLQAGDLAVVLDNGNAGGHGGDSSMNMDGVRAVHANANEESSVTFMASEPGTYNIVCTVDDHEEMGMVGTLIVTE